MSSSIGIAALLVLALLAWLALSAARRAARRRDAWNARLAQLERQLAEQHGALERAEASRAAAEAELRAGEERYAAALRGSQDGMWDWDLASGRVQLSPRWKSMLGFEAHELADDLQGWRSRVHTRTALRSTKPWHVRWRAAPPRTARASSMSCAWCTRTAACAGSCRAQSRSGAPAAPPTASSGRTPT
jgi:PAS domain-containing protein